MKNHTFRTEIIFFISIFIFFILPPIFSPLINNEIQLFTEWSFPLQQMIFFIISLFIFILFNNVSQKKFLLRFPVILTFGLLFCSSLLMKFFSEILHVSSGNVSVILPGNIVQWFFCILNFFFAAFYEEIIYRFYFVDSLINIVNRKFNKKFVIIFCEIVGCLLFAFAHYYLGWLSVINAVFGHLILRICYKKNSVIWPCIAAHFIYNVISLILL